MAAIDPEHFFFWEAPRVLLDIRNEKSFQNGSLEEAISFPVDEKHIYQTFDPYLQSLKSGTRIHLMDYNGHVAEKIANDYPVDYLSGGYKGLKKWRENAFEDGPLLIVLGGYTGAGKSEMLRELIRLYCQVLDLEALAFHRGSAFGALAQIEQPSHDHFQNQLCRLWQKFDTDQAVWVEEKGPFLGKAGLPVSLYNRMKSAPLVHLDVGLDRRVDQIFHNYQDLSHAEFRNAILRLESRMGMSQNHKALHLHDIGKKKECIRLLLGYYDQAYQKRRQADWKNDIFSVTHNPNNPSETGRKLVALQAKMLNYPKP